MVKDNPGHRPLPISVVICARNSESTIAQCLQSVSRNNPAEILVMDGGSSDKTGDIARRYTDRVFISQTGLGHRFHTGTEQARQEYIAFIDSDVVVPDGTLELMLEELRANDFAGIQAQVKASSTSNYWEWARQADLAMIYNHPGEVKTGLTTMTALWKREVLLKHNFDPFFDGAYMDGDLSHRMARAGYRMGCSRTFIYHHHRSNFGRFMRQRYWHGKGCARFIWKYKTFLGLINLVIPVGPLHLAQCVLKRELRLVPYVFICDGAHWTGMITGLAQLVFLRISKGPLLTRMATG